MNLIRLRYKKWFNISRDGLTQNNPIAIAVLGICSALAVTNRVDNALAMGLAVVFVVTMSSLTVSLIRNFIPSRVRMVTYMVIISSFVIIVQLFLEAFFPLVAAALGAYLGLIITNCIVMGRAEAFAVKNPLKYTFFDGIANGLGYTYVLVIVAVVRELLAFGTILDVRIMPAVWNNWAVMALAPGGFFVLGLLIWAIRELTNNFETVSE
jgi:Na+-transporting NADH:ubiquinone oxidoreductase subunit D